MGQNLTINWARAYLSKFALYDFSETSIFEVFQRTTLEMGQNGHQKTPTFLKTGVSKHGVADLKLNQTNVLKETEQEASTTIEAIWLEKGYRLGKNVNERRQREERKRKDDRMKKEARSRKFFEKRAVQEN